ncbi:MAG: sulfite exporter TauE/SafE family protein [Steroidobacteraceae bacterium]|jgi:uncharacterized membrane protein YfcA|nr:sulfite exporter TauE/SafE family protein [Steroidobacteraceae bacterium]
MSDATPPKPSARLALAATAGLCVGVPGGLIGLGGAEFRLPLLIGAFGFPALPAVILNKATSLVVVGSGLAFRSAAVPPAAVLEQWPAIATLLSGSLAGAWIGASWATRLGAALPRVIALALAAIAVVLLAAHDPGSAPPRLPPIATTLAGIAAGGAIGVVASLLGVAGGELLVPTLVLLFGLDVKLAGSVSLAISLPTMLVGFARYSRDRSFDVLRSHAAFWLALAAGSVAGVALGASLVRLVSGEVLVPLLAAVLLLSAARLWRHR